MMEKKAVNISSLPAPDASFSRAFKVTLGGAELLFISGTASVGPNKETMHPDNFEKQARYAYKNIENILLAEGMGFTDIVKWTVFLKDMKYYERFEAVRAAVFAEQRLEMSHFPASTAVQAELCRPELLIEMECIALKDVA